MSLTKWCAKVANRSELEALLIEQAAEADSLRSKNHELLEALKNIMIYINKGVLVRNTDKDGDRDWHIKMLSFVANLKKAQQAIAKAKSTKE